MNEDLRTELLRRVAVDQEARRGLDTTAMRAADGENLPWLRQVVADVGWPGKSLVGGTVRKPRGCSPSTPTATPRSSGGAWTC